MKKNLILLAVFLLFSSCSKKLILSDDQVEEDLLYLNNKISPFTGKCEIVYLNTTAVKESLLYKKGKLCGKASGFYADGKTKWEGKYENGFMTGIWIFWNENGTKLYEFEYKNDTLNGKAISWDENGKVKEKGNYSNNLKIGEWINL